VTNVDILFHFVLNTFYALLEISSLNMSYLKVLASAWVLVAHTCNPSYSGGRDQEDHGSKPARANSSGDPTSKKPFTKTGW
jgi:hypothetical protein